MNRSVRVVIGLVFVFVIAAELGLQTWARYYRFPFETWDREAGTVALTPGIYDTGVGPIEINRAGFVGGPLTSTRPDLFRIAALGDSCTFGSGYRFETYPSILQFRLRDAENDSAYFEVVNAGVSGIDTEQALRRLNSTLAEVEPQIVLVYLGWNDLMKYSPRAQELEAPLSDLARWVDRRWLTRGLRKLLFFHLRPRLVEPATGDSGETGTFLDFAPTRFGASLAEIVVRIRELGAKPVLLTLPSPLHRDMDADAIEGSRIRFPYWWGAHRVGDFSDLLGRYNLTIRELAARQGVVLIDLDRSFRALPSSGGYFYDSMHTNAQGMALISRLILETLESENMLPTPSSSKPAGRG